VKDGTGQLAKCVPLTLVTALETIFLRFCFPASSSISAAATPTQFTHTAIFVLLDSAGKLFMFASCFTSQMIPHLHPILVFPQPVFEFHPYLFFTVLLLER
jgi:hypothetical protein